MSRKRQASILSSVIAIALTLGMFFLTESHVKKARSMHELIVSGVSEMSAMLKELVAANEQGGAPQMLSYARQNKPRATEAAKKLLTATTLDDITSANNELLAYNDLPQDQLFPSILLELIKELKAEVG